MTRLNKVRKLEERIAPSFFGLGANIGLSSDASADAGGHSGHVDSQAGANVNVSASAGWVNPLHYIRALEQHGLIETSANVDAASSFDTTIYKY